MGYNVPQYLAEIAAQNEKRGPCVAAKSPISLPSSAVAEFRAATTLYVARSAFYFQIYMKQEVRNILPETGQEYK